MPEAADYSTYVEIIQISSDGSLGYWPSRSDLRRTCARTLGPGVQADAVSLDDRLLTTALSRIAIFEPESYPWMGCPCGDGVPTLVAGRIDPISVGESALWVCEVCGWWEHSELVLDFDDGDNYQRVTARRRGLLREFNVASATAPIDGLRNHLRNHPDDLRSLHPRQLENLVAHLFRDYMNCEVIHVGGPGDGGVDVLVLDADDPLVIQVKRRSRPGSVESVGAIREFVGAMVERGSIRGLFVTTADHFSASAVQSVKRAVATGAIHALDLIDISRLGAILRLFEPVVPPQVFSRLEVEECFSTNVAYISGGAAWREELGRRFLASESIMIAEQVDGHPIVGTSRRQQTSFLCHRNGDPFLSETTNRDPMG